MALVSAAIVCRRLWCDDYDVATRLQVVSAILALELLLECHHLQCGDGAFNAFVAVLATSSIFGLLHIVGRQ